MTPVLELFEHRRRFYRKKAKFSNLLLTCSFFGSSAIGLIRFVDLRHAALGGVSLRALESALRR